MAGLEILKGHSPFRPEGVLPRYPGSEVDTAGDVDRQHPLLRIRPGCYIGLKSRTHSAPEQAIDQQFGFRWPAERTDLHACVPGGALGRGRRLGARWGQSLDTDFSAPAPQSSGRYQCIAAVVARAGEYYDFGAVPGSHPRSLERYCGTCPFHQVCNGKRALFVEPPRLLGTDDQLHQWSPTATAITNADVLVWVIVTNTSDTANI
jgi:hypothetical protein